MPNEENKAVVRKLFEECWNEGNVALVDQLISPNAASHDPANPGFHGSEGTKRLIVLYRQAFPDIHFAVEDQIAEGTMVVTRWTETGTHQGTLQGIPATGKRASVPGITVHRLAGGKIEEMWNNYDVLEMMQQLGLAPMPDQAMPLHQASLGNAPV